MTLQAMRKQSNWRASLTEQRTAWIIAVCGIIIIALSASQPQWFEFPVPSQHSNSATATVQVIPQTKTNTAKATAKITTTAKKASVTNRPSSKPAQTSRPASTQKTSLTHGFYVQLGAFQERPRARNFVQQLNKNGWSARIINKKNGLHAVWVGPKTSRSQAEQLAKSIHSKLKYKGFIIQHKP